MTARAWFRPPHRLVALFLMVTLVPSALLIVFGWRLFQQDVELERRQAESRREQAADVLVAALEQAIGAAQQALRTPSDKATIAALDHDAVVVELTRRGVSSMPAGRLAFVPVVTPGPEAPGHVFATGEDLEHRAKDTAAAAEWFAERARSSDPAVRAGALIRLARNLRKSGAHDAALEAYSRAMALPDMFVGGVPVELLARWGRCALLEQLGRRDLLATEAAELHALLLAGHWSLTRPVFELHLTDASRWARPTIPAAPLSAGLAVSVEQLWRDWNGPASRLGSGRDSLIVDGVPFTRIWQADEDRLVALVAGPRFVRRQWLDRLSSLEARHEVRLLIPDATSGRSLEDATRRSAADTGLPWTIAVTSDVQALAARASERRVIWLAALAVLAAIVIGGTYATGRAVSRELAVARLQSDFVAAVSHEFRTPLTSLRQLTEMLIDRPDRAVEKREEYYAALARQTERLHRLVESLLDFGRMEAGTSPYRRVPLAADQLIAEVVDQFAADPAARGHRVTLRLIDTGTIAADRDALTNALWNLLDNAAKYSPAAPDIEVAVERDGPSLAIHVRDRGFGMAPGEDSEVFRKFVRGARARTEGIAGTGIGLAIVHHVVTAHGGSIAVVSEPEVGSTFTIRLPLATGGAVMAQEGTAKCLES